jgi:hypothetical protein
MAFRLDHRAARDRSFPGEPKVMDCPLLVVGPAIVMRKLGGYLSDMLTVSRLFTRGDKPMKLNATTRREQAVQHLLVHRMLEAEAGCDSTVWPPD